MYDGVAVHGVVHQLRMEDVFWRRQRIWLKVVDLIIAALPAQATQEKADQLMRAWRELEEAVYVGSQESREERERKMMEMLKAQAQKSMEVMPLEEGR